MHAEWTGADLPENAWTFPLADRFHFLFSVLKGEETLGTFALTAQQLVGKTRNNANVCEIVEPLTGEYIHTYIHKCMKTYASKIHWC